MSIITGVPRKPGKRIVYIKQTPMERAQDRVETFLCNNYEAICITIISVLISSAILLS